MSISDQQLRQYVDNVFNKYDKNHSFTLNQYELFEFFKDLFASMNIKQNVRMEDVKYSLKQIDANHDGKVTKRELFNALKMMLGGNKATLPQTPKTPNGNRIPNTPFEVEKKQREYSAPKQQEHKKLKQNYQRKQSAPKNREDNHHGNNQHRIVQKPQSPHLPPPPQKKPTEHAPLPGDMMDIMKKIGMGLGGMMGDQMRGRQIGHGGMGSPMGPFGFW